MKGVKFFGLALLVTIGGCQTPVELLTEGSDKLDMQPSVSPDSQKIAFIRHRRLMILDLKTGHLRRLQVEGLISFAHPAWSPNGKNLCFSAIHTDSDEPPSVHLILLDMKTLRWRCLTPTSRDFNTQPSWSPDGKKIVFTRSTGKTSYLCLYDLSQERVTEWKGQWGRAPNWSPDGKRIAFVSGKRTRDLWLINADGSDPSPLLEGEGTDEDEPSWSPDGRFIIFTRQREMATGPPKRELWAIRLKDKKLLRLTECPDGFWVLKPCCFPDGKWIVFSLRRKDHAVLCRVKIDWDRLTPQKLR